MTLDPKGLEPCPHCGDLAALIRDDHIFANQHYDKYPGQRHGFRVECRGACHSMTCWWHTEAEAIAAWNRRVPAIPPDMVLVPREPTPSKSYEDGVREAAQVARDYPFDPVAEAHSNQAVVTNAAQNIATAILALLPNSGGRG